MFESIDESRLTKLHAYVSEYLIDAGDSISYPEIAEILELPSSEGDSRATIYQTVTDVNKRLWRDGDWRHLINIENSGYRIATPVELREDAFDRMRRSERQQVANRRAIEKVIRHPDATPGERKRATDAANKQAVLLAMLRREQRSIKKLWPAEEVSPVPKPDDEPPGL